MSTRQPEVRSAVSQDVRAGADVAIVGGGVTGLSAAWYLEQEAAQRGITLNYTILEESNLWGGKVHTEQIDSFDETPFVLEAGAEAFLIRKPWAFELAQELGLAERLLAVNADNNRTFVLRRGKPVPLPDGLQLLVPTRLLPFMRSPLFSPWGKARAWLDLLIPPRQSEADETLANFVKRRLGAEVLDRIGEPLLAGVYNGDPERQSMLATFPQFPALERQHGSLIWGMRAVERERIASSTPPFFSFKTGAHELIGALVGQLNGDLHLNTPVSRLERLANGRYRIVMKAASALEADAIIMTTPAHVTARLVGEIAPAAAEYLSGIPYAGIGTAYLAFRNKDVPYPLRGFGLVVPSSEHRRIDGVTWTSSKWNYRAPSSCVLLRVFFGGPRTRETLYLDDDELVAALRAELRSIFGIVAAPLLQRIYRWQDGYPQYNLGHLERVAAVEQALPPGLYVAGSAYRGVGVPDCIRQGRDTAIRVSAMLVEKLCMS